MRRSQGFDIVVVGSINYDYLARGPELPTKDKSVLGEEFAESPGGKGRTRPLRRRAWGRVWLSSAAPVSIGAPSVPFPA